MTVAEKIEFVPEIKEWLIEHGAITDHMLNCPEPIAIIFPGPQPDQHTLIRGDTIQHIITEYCHIFKALPPANIVPKLKPFTCKRCRSVLAFVSNHVVKVGGLVANIEQGAVVIRCEQCGNSRCWKPCNEVV